MSVWVSVSERGEFHTFTLMIAFTPLTRATCHRVCLCFSVVGPALTFRIRQNEHNMTAAEVAAKAGETQKTHMLTPTYPKRHIK